MIGTTTTVTPRNPQFARVIIIVFLLVCLKVKFDFSLWGQGHEYEIEEILKEVAYFKGVTYYVSDFCGSDNALEECFESNLYYYANLVRFIQ